MTNSKLSTLLLVGLLLCPCGISHAFNPRAHESLTRQALTPSRNPRLDSWLKDALGLLQGIRTVIPAAPGVLGEADLTVGDIAAQGSVDEDWPENRAE